MPALGYPDYQRVSNWDSPLVLNESAVEHEGTYSSGRIECSRYGYIAGRIVPAGMTIKVRMQWFPSKAGVEVLGERTFFITPGAFGESHMRIPSMGPWCTVQIEPEKPATKYTMTTTLLLTNRMLPSDSELNAPQLLAPAAFKLAAKANKAFNSEGLYGGPAEVWVESTQAKLAYRFQGLLKGFAFENFRVESIETIRQVAKVILPFTAWRLQVENLAAVEAELFVAVIPSITGSG